MVTRADNGSLTMMQLLIRIDSWAGKLIKGISIFCASTLFILLLLNVAARFFHINSFPWLDEVVEWSFSWLVFFGAAALWREGEHFRIDWIIKKLEKFRLGKWYLLFPEVLTLCFFAAMTWYATIHTMKATQWTSILRISKRLLYLCIPASGGIMTLYSIRKIVILILTLLKEDKDKNLSIYEKGVLRMKIREAVHPSQAMQLNTDQWREHFLVRNLFTPDEISMTYSYYDRMIICGVMPTETLGIPVDKNIIGVATLLERREMGIINVGGSGKILADGKVYTLEKEDALYLGKGTGEILFESLSKSNPAKFYINSCPAHEKFPAVVIKKSDAQMVSLGSIESSNQRNIYKYIHPEGVESCQLVMGLTQLYPCNVWNTMPGHTHQRRMEIYFYYDIPEHHVVLQIMGQPHETRHVVARNEEALLHPSWSMHSGVGTHSYNFIWAMAGENQDFSDMDHISMDDLK